ncbi:PQQ-dependent sugar dehydrogenase [Spirosoma soli]|uniref:PQQ-dependent sugar dehydrogenase n=1 Tax=Spirosoma soli TaxID=1770529 RepID=A0ABW5M830_9BACT
MIIFTAAERSTAQTYPTGFSQVLVANGINRPTAVAFAPDGRIFVTEQTGALRVIKNGSLLPTPFVQLTVNSQGERGLIGIAIDPNFAANQYIYLYYTSTQGAIHNRVSRFTASGDVVLAGSEQILLDMEPLNADNHNGGALSFGKDGKLYIGVGENAVPAYSQNLDNHLGKVLRINPDGTIPADNPFPGGSAARRRIWAFGLRNPYNITAQPGTGRIFVNDVGQNTWEEINDATTKGLNFGWPDAEGASSTPGFTNPVYAYPHGGGDGKGCSITGGTFFNPTNTNYPAEYVGKYFYQEFCNGWINQLDVSGSSAVRSPFAVNLPGLGVGLSTGTDGNLYFLSIGNSAIYKIVYTPANNAPQVANAIGAQSAQVGQSFAFAIPANTFTDPNGDALTLSVEGLPAGLSFTSPATISGTPSTSGTAAVTVKATDPGSLTASTQFTLTISPASVTPANFAIIGVSPATCVTLSAGQRRLTFTPQYTGLSGTPVSFSVANEMLPTTAAGPYTLNLYTDNPAITLRASQQGTPGDVSFVYNWLAACNGNPPVNTAPRVIKGIANQTATQGQFFTMNLAGTFSDDQTPDQLTLSVTNLPSGLNFTAPATISGTPSVSGTATLTVTATDPGSLAVSTQFTLTINPPSVNPVNFTISGVSGVSCAVVSGGQRRVTFTPQYTGLSGAPVSFSVANEMLPTTAAGPYTLNLYTDNPVITLKAVQQGTAGEASFTFGWLAACGSARVGAEPASSLSVVVLGNPVPTETAYVEIRGATGQTLFIQAVDSRGHVVDETAIKQAASVERASVQLSRPAGIYFIQVNTAIQKQTVKIIKP